MNVVDTSAWLEYFGEGQNAKHFAAPIENTKALVVPVICIYEVFKKLLQDKDETNALQAIALMNQGQVVDLNSSLALSAAKISVDQRIPMADSIVLAIAHHVHGTLWTQDADFKDLPNVKFFAKTSAKS